MGEQKRDSYLLGNGVSNDDVAFWDIPGHSGGVSSKVSDCHIHRRRRLVCGCQCVSRLAGSTHRLALVNPHAFPLYSPARTNPRSQLTSRRTVGLKYGERGTSEAMVPAESAGKRWGVRLTSRRRYWSGRSCGGSRAVQNARMGSSNPGLPTAQSSPRAPLSPRLPRLRISRAPPARGPALPTPTSAGPCGRFRPREAARCPEGGPSPDSAVLPLPHSGAGPARRAARARAAGGGRRRSGRGARDCGTPRARTRRVVRP